MWLDAMLDYVIGDNYPNPVRCLKACEQPIKAYLNQELFSSEAQPFDIFAVEGGTAGICYLFDTLANNYLLEKVIVLRCYYQRLPLFRNSRTTTL